MTTGPSHHERRAAQRFEFSLPVSIRVDGTTLSGCTQNISGRGMFLFSEREIAPGCSVELTFSMPAEVTLAEAMRVRCRGRILRTAQAGDDRQFGLAICLESYEYLTGVAERSAGDFERISGLHEHERRDTESARLSPRVV